MEISVYGEVYLPVNYDHQEMILPLIVVDGDGLKLLGRNFLEATEVELEQYLPCEQDWNLVRCVREAQDCVQ